MVWVAHTLPGELLSEEEINEMQELLADVMAYEPNYFILEEGHADLYCAMVD
jgi:hypothetical protein